MYVYAFFAWTLLSGPIAAKYGSRFMLRVGVLSEFVVRWVLIYGGKLACYAVYASVFWSDDRELSVCV